MSYRKLILASCLSVTALLAHTSCRPAVYEIIRNGKKSEPRPPQPFDGPQGPTTENKLQADPTARVEVMWNNNSVTRVWAGEPTKIRPSLDTVDPDDVGVIDCVNPGIIKAEYVLGKDGEKSAARDQGCESLEVPHVFQTPGEYVISMIVTSNENEKASATMTLLVIDRSKPIDSDGGFTITAVPILTRPNTPVAFTGHCTFGKTQTIDWDFDDGAQATGKTTSHPYAKAGRYEVKAVCTDETGRKQTSSVTVAVVDGEGPLTIPGNPGTVPTIDPPVTIPPPDAPVTPSPTPGPNQRPGQLPTQKPSQRPVIRR